MPETKTKKTKEKTTTKPRKTTSPFKAKDELEAEIKAFVNKFKATVVNQATRMSDFFEMSCFNHIVTFYERNDYIVQIENLQSGKYRYKCSTAGLQSNFSYFGVSKKIGRKNYIFEVQHNLAVQSSHSNDLFTTPDIVVIKKGKVKISTKYYDSKRRFCYVKNEDFITFCEVKQFNPFPELLFNFIGVVNELRKEILTNSEKEILPKHIAPSLMISGKPNKPAQTIRDNLEERYCINIIYDIFDSGSATFSKMRLSELRTTGNKPSR
ncbi:hypothetical protein [Gelidibacter gilvus]|uniref:Uncharacterized protein n=1 Tax=Gelidibacter gilvus TaxID=59602 RepID=A0A4Q0XLI3_9FLAO|nr:hypothetical protein [Gelidibacter gilvus]RXJ51219.1 hypothetical protein ESZ48_04925 [Gelidibacter gilvus]